jgi:dTDP-N-acetylfucosamine:lipid II N-acetylfucosaminyltransferase
MIYVIIHVLKASSSATSPVIIKQILADSHHVRPLVKKHVFFVFGDKTGYYEELVKKASLCFFQDKKSLIQHLKTYQDYRLIVHGVPFNSIFKDFLFSGIKLKHISWINWGHGHSYSRRQLIKKYLDKYLMRKLNSIIALTKYDEYLIEKLYKSNNVHFLPYRSENIQKLFHNSLTSIKHSGRNILLGVSAGKPQRHSVGIECLSKLTLKDISVYAPLSYNTSDEKYIRSVIDEGHQKLGDSFYPLKALMPIDQYVDFLRNMDMIILPSLKQNGLFNVYILLYLGKKIFVSEKSNMFISLTKLGFQLETLETINNDSVVQDYPIEIQRMNKHIVLELFDLEKSAENLKLFYSKLCSTKK